MAGAWSLGSSSEITPTEAAEWVAGYDWGMGDDDIESDEAALASEIMHAQIRFESKTGARTRAISELIQHITGEHYDPEIGEKDAEAALVCHGLRIKDDRLYVSESHPELRKILKDTSWGGSWGRILERLPGADKVNLMRFSGEAPSHRDTADKSDVTQPYVLFDTNGPERGFLCLLSAPADGLLTPLLPPHC